MATARNACIASEFGVQGQISAREMLLNRLEQHLSAALASKPLPEQVAQDKEHAENYRLVSCGQHWSVVDGIGNTLRGDDLDAAVAAIRAARSTGGQP